MADHVVPHFHNDPGASVIEIGAVVESNVQIGALSFVPKYAHLEGNAIYAGVPVKRLEGHAPARVRGTQPAAS